jgi:hypothetical protein
LFQSLCSDEATLVAAGGSAADIVPVNEDAMQLNPQQQQMLLLQQQQQQGVVPQPTQTAPDNNTMLQTNNQQQQMGPCLLIELIENY